jgi:hypothetical protein
MTAGVVGNPVIAVHQLFLLNILYLALPLCPVLKKIKGGFGDRPDVCPSLSPGLSLCN